MSACYLVRLGRPLRCTHGESGISDEGTFHLDRAYVRSFATREAAERFTRDHFPLSVNPFDDAVSLWKKGPGVYGRPRKEDLFCANSYFPSLELQEQGAHVQSVAALCDWIREAGLEPPGLGERDDPAVWPLWWELVTEGLDFLECLRLQHRLGLPAWSAGLTDVRHWMADEDKSTWMPGDGTLRFFWQEPFPLSEWRRLLEALRIEPRPFPQNHTGWQVWWDTQVTDYEPAIQTLLWWALVPYPYEIVALDLEGGTP